MRVTIAPKQLQGSLRIPSSKSAGHRLILAAALSGGGQVTNLTASADIQATLDSMKALGMVLDWDGHTVRFRGRQDCSRDPIVIDCNESGSTLRFLIPVALALCPDKTLIFKGQGRLLERPLTPYLTLFEGMEISCQKTSEHLQFRGRLSAGAYPISGKISSQFITGLLLALPLLEQDSRIVITDELESKGYVDMTLDALSAFGIQAVNRDYREFLVPGGQHYCPADVAVEGDYSQAAFFYAANFIGSAVRLDGLAPNSSQGDRAVEAVLKDFAAADEYVLDVSDIPDLVPALAAAAAYRAGKVTRFVNAARLRMKESDRITATCAMLRSLGAQAEAGADSLSVWGQESLPGTKNGVLDCCNDHRIAMAAAAAAVGCTGKVVLSGAECVRKSYPTFWADYRSLGGNIEEDDE